MVLIILLALLIFGFAAYCFLKGIWLILKAGYYLYFASEKQIDEGFKKEVLAKDPSYKKFEQDFDKNIGSILNKKQI